MLSGGSTKPWRIVGIDGDKSQPEETPYVVKLFTERQIIQGHSIAKEFICNTLASQFDLEVPEACLVNLRDEGFKSTLEKEPLKNLSQKYSGPTFSSRLIDASLINEQLKGPAYRMHDYATLFAFDCLIFNTDRGGYRNKPNLLVDDEGFILIDHELTFSFIDSGDDKGYNKIIEDLNGNAWPSFYQKHLFYPLLKSYRGPKKNLFDTFEESLRTLDINQTNNLINELKHEGVEVGSSDLLISYLRILKQNSHTFRNILLGLIS